MSEMPPRALPLPEEFAVVLNRRAARLDGFASRVAWYDTVTSTNDLADRAASAGAPHGTVVAAEAQEGGRGRMGRTWYSPPGAGLYVSVVLRPGLTVAQGRPVLSASSITLTAGVALAEALRSATGLPAEIKWPNDLVVGRRKLCGVLAEAAAAAGDLQHVVLGFGVNVHLATYPTEIAERVTSIEAELGRPVDRAEVFAEALACLAERLRQLSAGGFGGILDRWRALSPTSTGARVEVLTPRGWRAGITTGVDADGALLVTREGGAERVVAGEVRWL